jgi:hypothetical protein
MLEDRLVTAELPLLMKAGASIGHRKEALPEVSSELLPKVSLARILSAWADWFRARIVSLVRL